MLHVQLRLVGPITAYGGQTYVTSQTGTGSTFVMQAGPTITGALLVSNSLGSEVRFSDTGVVNADWGLLAQTGNTTPLYRVFNRTLFQDVMTITPTGAASILASLGINGGTALTTTNQTGTGSIAMSASPAFTGTATFGNITTGVGTEILVGGNIRAVDNTNITFYTNTGDVFMRAGTGGTLHLGANATNSIVDVSSTGLSSTGTLTGTRLISNVATGTAPLTVSSTTRVSNLNAATCGNADTVTTNANLTGPITSSGNATSVASQTGTGSKFVMDTGPAISSPTFSGNIVVSDSSGTTIFNSTGDVFMRAGTGGTLHLGANATNSIVDVSSTGLATTGSVTDAKGDVRTIPQNSKSAAYTTVLADAGRHILHPSADTTARTFTIDSNANVAYPIGTAITFVNQNAAGTLTISITTDIMRLAGAGTTGSRTLAANGIATALKITSTEWIISGTNLS